MGRNIITNTLSDKQYEILGNLLKSTATYNILNAGRQSGKTYTMSRMAFILSILKENAGSKVLVVAPYNVQSDTFFFNVMQIAGVNHFIKKTLQSPYKTIILNNGSVIDFRSADNPKSIRSKSYNFIFLDEFAFFKDEAFDLAIVPTLIASGDTCKLFFSSTPNGVTGMFYDMAEKGMDDEELNYTYNYMNYNHNPNRNLDIIESERLRQPSNRFRQEFLGEFISDGGDVFDNFDDVCVINSRINALKGENYFAGVDWGRANDKTVLTILNKKRQTVFCESFSGNWEKQINEIGIILNEYKPITYAESNGIGDPLISQLKKVYTNVKPFITTNPSKKEIVENLRMIIIKKEIELPSKKLNINVFKEISNYTYSITKTGKIAYHHRPNEHDDHVDSIALANHSYNKHTREFKQFTHERKSSFHS